MFLEHFSLMVPTGTIEVLNGVNAYVATPSGDYDKSRVLLFLADAFGWDFVNNRVGILVQSHVTPVQRNNRVIRSFL
jgi:hypothetical protein